MRKVCAKMVPKILSEDQKQKRVKFCDDMLDKIKHDSDILRQIITGDETWLFQYDPKTKRQNMQWKTAESQRSKKVRVSKSKIKVMLIDFFNQKGMLIMNLCLRVKQRISTNSKRKFSFASITEFEAASG